MMQAQQRIIMPTITSTAIKTPLPADELFYVVPVELLLFILVLDAVAIAIRFKTVMIAPMIT